MLSSPPVSPRLPTIALAVAWLLALVGAGAAFQRPAPLFLNLGAGDDPFARGFRGGWERDGLQGSGETMFHWTADGARLEFPVFVESGALSVRLRLARFADTPADVLVEAGGVEFRTVDHWTQHPRGWTVREISLGDVRGPLRLRFRSSSRDDLGLALDWVEVSGVRQLRPATELGWGLLALLGGVPLLAGLFLGTRSALAFGAGLSSLAAGAVLLDRLGGLCALGGAGLPALVVVVVLGTLDRLGRWRRADVAGSPSGLTTAVGAAVVALVAVSHPFYYYPDVDTHARFVKALREDPSLGLDARPFQVKTGAWTRQVGRQRVAFPYSPVFHLLAMPLSPLFGDVSAVKTVGVVALGATVLLVHALAAALGLGTGARVVAQALVCLIPVLPSRLALALYPTLLGQALELLVIVSLAVGRWGIDGWRGLAFCSLFLAAVQAAYTGSLFGIAAFVLCLVVLTWAEGERTSAWRLLAAYATAVAAVLTLLYARFLPVLWNDVLPNARNAVAGPGEAAPGFGRAILRVRLFYDLVYPLLLIPGWLALRDAPRPARRALGAALLAGAGLLALRYGLPGLFRDAKEVELLSAPVAVVTAAAFAWLWGHGTWGRAAAAGSALLALHFGVTRAVALYAERFFAIGR